MKVLLDEDFNNDILRGMLRRNPNIDYIRVQDVPEIYQHADPVVLEWAANHDRILLTHDVQTMTNHAYDRVRSGLKMPGVFEVSQRAAYAQVIDDLLLVIDASEPDEWTNQVRYIPFK